MSGEAPPAGPTQDAQEQVPTPPPGAAAKLFQKPDGNQPGKGDGQRDGTGNATIPARHVARVRQAGRNYRSDRAAAAEKLRQAVQRIQASRGAGPPGAGAGTPRKVNGEFLRDW